MVEHFVVPNGTALGTSAVFGSSRVRKVPFYERCPIHKWYVIQVDDLGSLSPGRGAVVLPWEAHSQV